MIFDCIIAGAGAAGLYCSATFPEKINGLILEKNRHPGTKLLMSGGGQCNLTHSGSIKDFIPHYGKNGGRIRGCLYKFNNTDLCSFFENNGIPLFYREDGKVFPKSMKASDILDLLMKKTEENGFRINYNSEITAIEEEKDIIRIHTGDNIYLCRKLILATGGFSYPSTGSDGNIFPVLKRDLGIKLTDFHPSLSPVYVEDYPYGHLSGISFKSPFMTITRDGKKIADGSDGLLFTHKDFSGPLVLNLSKMMFKGDILKFNYLYPLTAKEVTDKITTGTSGNKGEWKNILPGILDLPKSFLETVLKDTGNKPKAIAQRLTSDTFTIKKVADFKTAMATSGGVSLSEIDMKTMSLKKHPRIFVIGEMTDIDGHTGGYNLQFAYSSAKAANTSL